MTKQELIEKIESLKSSAVSEEIKKRIKEFESAGKQKEESVFSELCFCLMTANFQAEKCIRIQKELGRSFSFLPEKELAEELKKMGHRFPNTRANYITEARSCSLNLKDSIMKKDSKEMREWLVENVKGLGLKEASHFLRNIGYKDLAIIDFHIIDLLNKEQIIQFDRKSKAINKKTYLEIEETLRAIASETKLNLAELDLYLWYLETGKILK